MSCREVCKLCGRVSAVGFRVPDPTWERVSQGRWSVLCLTCFTGIADEIGVKWCQEIDFYPVSRAALEERTERFYLRWGRLLQRLAQ